MKIINYKEFLLKTIIVIHNPNPYNLGFLIRWQRYIILLDVFCCG